MREGTREGSRQLLGEMEDTSPHPSPPWAPANRPDLRTRGAQDAKHAAKLFDVILPGEKRGSIQQLPQDAAHSPADTKTQTAHRLHMDMDLPTPAPSLPTGDTGLLISAPTSHWGQGTHKVA